MTWREASPPGGGRAGLGTLVSAPQAGIAEHHRPAVSFEEGVALSSVFVCVSFGQTITFVLSTVGLQRSLDIDEQFNCWKEEDKNEWKF